MLDLGYTEDSAADTDMNIVMSGDGRFVEVQGTAEGQPFDRDELDQLLDLGAAGAPSWPSCSGRRSRREQPGHPRRLRDAVSGPRWCWPPTTRTSSPSCAGSSPRPPRTSQVLGLADLPRYPEPAETERTFAGNALIKARAAVAVTGLPALADDSGLEVDVLNGMPGVRSARWAGPQADRRRQQRAAAPPAQRRPAATERTARFVCAMAAVLPDGDRTRPPRASCRGGCPRHRGRQWVRLRPAVRGRRARR